MSRDKTSKPSPTAWADWNPGLENGQMTLGEVYASLPTYEFDSYPWIVLLLESPKSPVALKGRCTLLRHDLIHVLIGRGLFVQDEAFVIGYAVRSPLGAAGIFRIYSLHEDVQDTLGDEIVVHLVTVRFLAILLEQSLHVGLDSDDRVRSLKRCQLNGLGVEHD